MDPVSLPTVTPSALINLFANAIQMDAAKQMHRLKGIYLTGKGVAYGGQYYDGLKDELTDASITLIIPGLIRSYLSDQQVIEVVGYLTRRVQVMGARVELQFIVTELAAQNVSAYSEDDLETFALLQQKAEQGYRDVDGLIKTKILNGEPITIRILIGKSAIIDTDIIHQLREATGFYDIGFIRINLANENEIINAIKNTDADVLVVSRGGGERMEVFNKPAIVAAALTVKPLFVTAIGHSQDIPLLQKVADKAFITPTAFGQHLNDLYNHTIEERSRSKARIVEDVTKQLKGLYDKQVTNLQAELNNKEAHFQAKQQLLEERLLLAQVPQAPVPQKTNWALILLLVAGGMLAGVAIGYLLLR